MEKVIDEIVRQSMLLAPKFGVAVLIFLVAWALGKGIERIIFRIGTKFEQGKSQVLRLAGTSGKIAMMLFGCVTALGTMGINVTALVAGLGLSGFALGFALKDALSNVLAGALILIYQPFRYRDRIAVSGFEGEVIEVNLRYTILQGENKRYLIPNSTLFTNLIQVAERKQ